MAMTGARILPLSVDALPALAREASLDLWLDVVPPASRPSAGQARAYCGPAHHRCWTLPPSTDPPALVDLPVPDGSVRYRLVRHPRSGRPARDHCGNFLYVPVPDPRPPPAV